MICSRPAHDLLTTCSSLAQDLLKTCSRNAHDLLMTCKKFNESWTSQILHMTLIRLEHNNYVVPFWIQVTLHPVGISLTLPLDLLDKVWVLHAVWLMSVSSSTKPHTVPIASWEMENLWKEMFGKPLTLLDTTSWTTFVLSSMLTVLVCIIYFQGLC